MANRKSMREACDRLDLSLLELSTFCDLAIDLAGPDEGSPAWPWLVRQMANRIALIAHELGSEVRRC